MIWILTVCTQAWIMCGTVTERKYETEDQCYRAMSELYAQQGRDKFKYILCAPEKEEGR